MEGESSSSRKIRHISLDITPQKEVQINGIGFRRGIIFNIRLTVEEAKELERKLRRTYLRIENSND